MSLALLLAAVWIVIGACTTEELGFVAGDICDVAGTTACDADGMVVLQCADGVWQPFEDCLNGCTEESGSAACIGNEPSDEDTAATDKPSLPENEPTITDDATVAETEEPTGDDAVIETDDVVVTDDATVTDDAVVTDDATVTDDTVVTDDDTVTDDALVTDDDTVTDDALATDDATVTDEDGLITDADTTPVTCTAITLPYNNPSPGNKLAITCVFARPVFLTRHRNFGRFEAVRGISHPR